MIITGIIIIMITPLHRLLPGYLKESLRVESQQSAIRIDSLSQILDKNQLWIDNLLTVTNTQRQSKDSINYAGSLGTYNPDSLLDAGIRESKFVSSMEERERFNISVLAPLDADGMMFSPVAPNALIASQTRNSTTPQIILPSDSPIQSIADGSVLATYISPALGGNCILVQHARGFVSAYYHTGNPLVTSGDAVNAGQAIALAPKPDSKNSRWINLKIWYNGTPTPPADFIGY